MMVVATFFLGEREGGGNIIKYEYYFSFIQQVYVGWMRGTLGYDNSLSPM